jgi:hypothetical protein
MRMGWQLYRSGEPCRGHASRQCGVQALSEGPPDSSRSRPAHVSCAQQHTRTPPSTTCTHQHRHAWQADIEPLLVAADWANATDSADGPSTALDCCCCCPGFTPALRLVTVQVALGALRHGHVCIGLSSAGGGRVQQRWRLIAAARRCRRCVRCCAACCAGLPCPRAGGWQRLRHRVPQARVGDAGRGVGRGLPLAPLPPAAHTCGWCGLEHNTGESGGVGACSALARTRSDPTVGVTQLRAVGEAVAVVIRLAQLARPGVTRGSKVLRGGAQGPHGWVRCQASANRARWLGATVTCACAAAPTHASESCIAADRVDMCPRHHTLQQRLAPAQHPAIATSQ